MTTKKPYEAPEMNVYQVKKASIIATSSSTQSNESYLNGNDPWSPEP